MYKILLVDDEKLVLKSLQASVDWEVYGFEIAGTANLAGEALEKIGILHPDVIFTDIHMPDMSGLELLSLIRQENPNIYCIVISGYAEFAYVQKALRLESVGYCLKPFDYEEITGYLRKIKHRLDREREKKLLSCVLADYMVRRDKAAVAYMEAFYAANGIDFLNQNLFAVYIIGEEIPGDLNCAFLAAVGHQKFVCLVRMEAQKDFFGRLEKAVQEKKLHAGYTGRIDAPAAAPQAISEAYRCACQFFCTKDAGWLTEAPESWEDRLVVKRFQEELRQKNPASIEKSFLFLKQKFQQGRCSIDAALMIRNMVEMVAEDGVEDGGFAWNYDCLLEEFDDAEQMLDMLEEQCRLMQRDDSVLRSITNQTFREIYDFVENNYQKPITASELAQQFHINNCYVSQLFKKELGKSFTEYVTEKRIQYACRLLRETDSTINEIAELAGFKDYFYFGRVFRKMKKCTPTEYRNSLEKGYD